MQLCALLPPQQHDPHEYPPACPGATADKKGNPAEILESLSIAPPTTRVSPADKLREGLRHWASGGAQIHIHPFEQKPPAPGIEFSPSLLECEIDVRLCRPCKRAPSPATLFQGAS